MIAAIYSSVCKRSQKKASVINRSNGSLRLCIFLHLLIVLPIPYSSTGNKATTELVQILEGDSQIVNVVQGHPIEPLLAVSGIDNTIKIFSPDHQLQEQARHGVGIMNEKRLSSCQRFRDRDTILAENEVGRQSGMRDAIITVSLIRNLRSRISMNFEEWMVLLGSQ